MTDEADWIEWHGGACPVHKHSRPTVRMRNGVVRSSRYAESWTWDHIGSAPEWQIVAYIPEQDFVSEEHRKAEQDVLTWQTKALVYGKRLQVIEAVLHEFLGAAKYEPRSASVEKLVGWDKIKLRRAEACARAILQDDQYEPDTY